MTDRHRPALAFLCLAGAYTGVATPFFAAWEIAQLPLYTIWRERSFAQNIAAALHCTLGDAVIAFLAFLAALWAAFLLGPRLRTWTIGTIAVAGGLLATLVIEVISTQVAALRLGVVEIEHGSGPLVGRKSQGFGADGTSPAAGGDGSW